MFDSELFEDDVAMYMALLEDESADRTAFIATLRSEYGSKYVLAVLCTATSFLAFG